MRVDQVMQADVVTVRPADSVLHLDELLSTRRITGAPVVDHDTVVGVVSRSDVVRQLELERTRFEGASWYLEPFDVETADEGWRPALTEAVAARLEKLCVRDLMTSELRSAAPDATLEEAARAMVAHRVHRLLVMDGTRLVGLVSSLDLLRGLSS